MRRTWTGRVVYDREKHRFSYTDVYRICRNVDPVWLQANRVREIGAIVSTILAAEADLAELLGGASLWQLLPSRQIVPLVLRFASRILDTVSSGPLWLANEVAKLFAGFTTVEESEATAIAVDDQEVAQ